VQRTAGRFDCKCSSLWPEEVRGAEPDTMRIGMKTGILVLLAVASGQTVRDNPLTSVTGLRCHFTTNTVVVWKSGKPDVHTEPVDSRITISDINIQEGTAEASGPQGRRLATAALSDGSLFVIETTRGAVDLITVFATESSPGRLKAAPAQHAYALST